VAVDVVSFGCEADNDEKLSAFHEAVNSNNNSHLVSGLLTGEIVVAGAWQAQCHASTVHSWKNSLRGAQLAVPVHITIALATLASCSHYPIIHFSFSSLFYTFYTV